MQWKDTQDGSALRCRAPVSQPLELPVKLSCRKSPWRKIITDQNRHLGLLLGWESCPFPPISMRCEEMWSLHAPGVGHGASSHHHRKMGKRAKITLLIHLPLSCTRDISVDAFTIILLLLLFFDSRVQILNAEPCSQQRSKTRVLNSLPKLTPNHQSGKDSHRPALYFMESQTDLGWKRA